VKPSAASSSRRRVPWLRPAVVGPVALLVLAGLGWGVYAWLGAAAAARERDQLVAAIDVATAKQPVDGGELSRLTTLLRKLPEHDTAPPLLAAAARIELARDRADRANELFGALASRPGAPPRDQALGARILLRVQEGDPTGPGVAQGILRQVIELALSAHATTRDPGDLLRAWQAARRANETARAAETATRLQAEHADSPEAGFVAFAGGFQPGVGVAAVERALAGVVPQPVEGLAMLAWAQLQANDVAAATATAEAALARAPGVGVVRLSAAFVFHACAVGSPDGSPQRASWVARRDAQIDWLERQEPRNEAWLEQCAELAKVR
jgi:hypothetical protein